MKIWIEFKALLDKLYQNTKRRGLGILIGFVLLGCLGVPGVGHAGEPVNPLTREHIITIDPTSLDPPTWWHVPGVTPLIWTKDPLTYESYRTTEVHDIKLKPGDYRFGTFTFDFLFRVTLDGQLEFDDSLAQCVKGQGTNKLMIVCSHTQPYRQERDYDYRR